MEAVCVFVIFKADGYREYILVQLEYSEKICTILNAWDLWAHLIRFQCTRSFLLIAQKFLHRSFCVSDSP